MRLLTREHVAIVAAILAVQQIAERPEAHPTSCAIGRGTCCGGWPGIGGAAPTCSGRRTRRILAGKPELRQGTGRSTGTSNRTCVDRS
ncbi:hypothetical protein NKG94_28720 [Micromonospora sp. M12]